MYTAFTVIGDVYAKIFLVADERMSGKWGGELGMARYARQGTRRQLCEA
jgi:hypothetical protein